MRKRLALQTVYRGARIEALSRTLVCTALAFLPATAAGQNVQAPGDAPTPVVQFEDILADPDDPELNYRFAKQQVEAGNLTAAASALERILIKIPEAHKLRLLYGIVLYRLGHAGEARQELASVDRQALSAPEDRATLDDFRGRLSRAEKRFLGTLGLTAGLHYDTNRNSFPADGEFQIDFPGSGPTTFTSAGTDEDDIGRFTLLDGTLDVATDSQRIPRITFEAVGFADDQVELDDLDLVYGLGRVSATYLGDRFDLEPRLSYRNIRLGGEQYLQQVATGLELRTNLTNDRRTRLFTDLSLGYQNYAAVARDPFADEKDGRHLAGAIGFDLTPDDRVQLQTRYTIKDKNARESYEAYLSHELEAFASYIFTPGLYGNLRGSFLVRDFDAPDPFVSRSEKRRDYVYTVGVGVSATAAWLGNRLDVKLPDALTQNLRFNLNGEHRLTRSNFPNFEYMNTRLEFAITKEFPF